MSLTAPQTTGGQWMPGSCTAQAPYNDCENVVTSSVDYVPTNAAGQPVTARGFIVGVAGIVNLVTPAGQTVAIAQSALTVGIVYPIAFTRITHATTTATGIVALI